MSADGLVILSHDRDLTRTAADPRGIGEMTWKELSELDAGDGRPPVRLDDALAAFPRLRFNIPLNEKVRRALSLEEIGGGKRGLFLLSVRDPDGEYWDEEIQIVNLSDLGLVVRVWEAL